MWVSKVKTTNLCKKVPGKKFLEKNLEIKTLEKSPNFIKSLGKMSLEIKSCVLDSWDFFSYNSMGAANKVSGNKIPGKKSRRKEIRGKEKPRTVNHAFSLVRGLFFRGLFCIKSYWSQKKSLELVGLYFRRLFNKRTFFHRTF